MLDLRVDAHVHTAFSAGRDSVSLLVGAAERAGLSEVTFADRVGPDSTWLPSYLAAIQRARHRTDLTLRVAAEVEAIGPDGWLAFPEDLNGLEMVSVTLGRLPLPAGPVGAEVVGSLLAAGVISADTVVEQVVTVLSRAVGRVARYAPTRLARPLAFLQRSGIAEDDLPECALSPLVDACRAAGTAVEVSERHRTPSARLAAVFAAAGVPLVAASDACRADDVGGWAYVRDLADTLDRGDLPILAAPSGPAAGGD